MRRRLAMLPVRRAALKNGGIGWHNHWMSVSTLLGEQYVGFEEGDFGLLDVHFGHNWLGRFVEAKRRRDRNHKERKL